jgi:tetratricopeptide (TPR) repeat protein
MTAAPHTLWRLKRYAEALEDGKKALILEPENEEYLSDFAYSLYLNKRYGEALEYCEKIGNLPASYLALRTRAMATLRRALAENGKITKAERTQALNDLEQSLEQCPDNGNSYVAQAQAFLLLGEHLRAYDSLEKALDIDPEEPNAYHWLGEYYRAVGDKMNAEINDGLAEEKVTYRSQPIRINGSKQG